MVTYVTTYVISYTVAHKITQKNANILDRKGYITVIEFWEA